jgi:hypothetical protein
MTEEALQAGKQAGRQAGRQVGRHLMMKHFMMKQAKC